MQVTLMRLMRWPAVLQAMGQSRATIHLRIKSGLFPPPVKIGPNAVGYPDREIAAINAAKVAGKSEDEIRELVRKLIEARKQPEAA